MEHFAAPPAAELIDIPYVNTENYDGLDFLSYPHRKGWSLDHVMGVQGFGNRSPGEVEAFFQTWLYFGCLISVFGSTGINVETSDFVRETEGGERFITTKSLPGFIQDWMNKEGMTDKNYRGLAPDHNPKTADRLGKGDRGQVVENILRRVLFFVERYCNEKAHDDAKTFDTILFWPMSPKIAMSIMAIGKPLMAVAVEIYGYPRFKTPHWGSSPFLNERLVKAGWCIGELPFFLENAAVDCDYYFWTYSSPRKQLNHDKCTKGACRAMNIDVATYVTKHTTSCHGCKMVPAPGEVAGIVEKRGIPMVSWEEGELKVAEYDKEPKSKYVAISHVWSDGMGNNDENALPECQLTHLQNMVDGLYAEKHESYRGTLECTSEKHVGFWMDTLCVPLRDETRTKAIRMMKEIYKSADRVLVLDSFVQGAHRLDNITEKSVRLYLSNWHRRLWTLQEGIYAQSLFFQFRDGAQTMKDMHPESLADHNSLVAFYSAVRGNCMGEFDPFYNLMSMAGSSESLLHSFSYSIRRRTTSKLDDESICLSTLLNLDPWPLFKLKGEKRTERFYELVKEFNSAIVFTNLPRLTSDGFRWAPRSLIGHSENPFPVREQPVAKATLQRGGGLYASFPGIEFDPGIISPHFGTNIFFMPHSKPRSMFKISLRPDVEGNCPTWDPGATYMLLLSDPMIKSVMDEGVALASALESVRMARDGGPFLSNVFSLVEESTKEKVVKEDAAAEAVLGTFEGKKKSGRIKIRYVCRAKAELMPKEFTWHHLDGRRDLMKGKLGFDEKYVVPGDWLDKYQRWCVL